MLGHLRFHRRGHSNPSSPVPDQLSPFDHGEHPQSVQDISSRPDSFTRPTNASNNPPAHPSSSRLEQEPAPGQKPPEQPVRNTTSLPVRSPPNSIDSGFIGGLALQNYRRAFESTHSEPSESAVQGSSAQAGVRTKPVPPPINTNLPSTRPAPIPIKEVRTTTSSSPSFVAPTDLQSNAGATGKRPAGTRLTSEPPALARSQTAAETQRAKKGRPFLKNPMSGLLMRRKASQNAPDLRPLPLPQKPTESTYDPRIRGTRVHDFSAPRQRVIPTRKPTVPGAEVWTGWDKYHNGPQTNASDLPLRMETSKSSSAASEATQAAASDGDDTTQPVDPADAPSQVSAQASKRISLEDKPLPAKPPGPSPVPGTTTRSVSITSRPMSVASSMQRTSLSTRTDRSRHISLSEDTLSALPKHMKSTSSRFSFDMIGAARAEKLLEERHRQRELERKANGVPTGRDSGFDDFDEDSFDYDAAMDDDGLEEAIPGVNADYDDHYYEEDIPMIGDDDIIDEEDDPDNDQENFAGFVFSRSNPQSSLVSPATPAMVITPRDASGRPIGHAITTDKTPDLLSVPSPLPMENYTKEKLQGEGDGYEEDEERIQLAGLGIRGLQAPQKTQYDPTIFQERRHMTIDDGPEPANAQDKGIYYDAGLLEELQMEADEIQKADFDESIFDDDDTDHFGRPIPGAFAQNLAMREKEQKKRESDMTSHSETSSTTAHTSVSVGMQPAQHTDKDAELSKGQSPVPISPPQENDDMAAAYQKALVDAACKAAAAGWKSRWDEGPESDAPAGDPDVTITSPTTGSQPSSAGLQDDQTFQTGDYEDDGFGGGFDDEYDDDLLDDAFIAEANAEALAYDSEGFYGDEFGFYSAPLPARSGFHGSSAPGSGSSSAGNESQYGGYFGPSGAIGRSASGRVLREPNLTPITERSEYSNRNSMMSMVLPSATLSELRNSMASPSFAHMAPGADDSETFSLSGLQRLRGKTFGGSQISLSSSRDGSPRSERAPLQERFDGASSPAPWELVRPQSHLGTTGGAPSHERNNSAYSVWSNSDAASASGSPTLTVAGLPLPSNNIPPQPLFSPPPPPIPQPSPGPQCPPVFEDEAEEAPSPGRTLKDTSIDGDEAEPGAVIPLTGGAPKTEDDSSSLCTEMDSLAPAEATQADETMAGEEGTSSPALIMTREHDFLDAPIAHANANNTAFRANTATILIDRDISVHPIPLSPASLDSPHTPPQDTRGMSPGRNKSSPSSVSAEDDHSTTILCNAQIPRSIFAAREDDVGEAAALEHRGLMG